MKKSDLKEKSPVFYIGKGVIILSIIVTSSLSFMLGFFVGKNATPPSAGQASVITPLADTIQKNIETEAKETVPQQSQQIPAAHVSEVQRPPEKPEHKKMNETQERPEIKRVQQPQVKQNREPQQSKENEKAVTTKEAKKSQEPQESSKKVKYTVQIGAFQNTSEADSLKAKFSEKGYKVFIIVAKPKKHEKLYKVLVGEFGNRKEAELLSVKIKKAEGTRAFVTLKTDLEGVR